MWSRVAGTFTWVYVETRTRAQAEKRIRKMCEGEMPEVVEYGVDPPDRLVVYFADPKIGKPSWTYVNVVDGEWWFKEKDFPEAVRRVREERNTYEGAGVA